MITNRRLMTYEIIYLLYTGPQGMPIKRVTTFTIYVPLLSLIGVGFMACVDLVLRVTVIDWDDMTLLILMLCESADMQTIPIVL